MFNRLVVCLLGFWLLIANPAIADKQLSRTYAVEPSNPVVNPAYVEARVREYFADIPVMVAIASCESGFRQYEADGRLLVNPSPESTASGLFQILYITHKPAWSISDSTDITTLEGNMRFARKMYEESGTAPWSSSKSCWQKRKHRYETLLAMS